jgi:hypothetical protein
MSRANNRTTYINFHNMSELPIMVDSWVDGSNRLCCLRVGPGEKLSIHSSVGEWHINSMLDDEADSNMWRDRGLEKFINLGKFRSDPCASGNYAWMEWPDIFDCVYSNCKSCSENNVSGLVTFTYTPRKS